MRSVGDDDDDDDDDGWTLVARLKTPHSISSVQSGSTVFASRLERFDQSSPAILGDTL